MPICPNCRACRAADSDRYCRMCGADTLEPELAATPETIPAPAVDIVLSQLQRDWEGDVAHWLRAGAHPNALRALIETAITKAQSARLTDD